MKQLFRQTWIFAALSLALCAPVSAEETSDKIKEGIDCIADAFKAKVDQLGSDLAAIQDYLDHYQWKGVIEGSANSGNITLSDLRLNEHHRAVVVKPGSTIEADVACFIDPEKSEPLEIYRAVIGYQGIGPQVSICSCLGVASGKKLETFTLQAPLEPGVYQLRFRTVSRFLERTAFAAWEDENGDEPDASTTIGIVIVKS